MALGPALSNALGARIIPVMTAAIALGMGGCTHLDHLPLTEPPADLRSPLAGDLKQLDLKTAAYPSFLQMPNQPTDVRPVVAWNKDIFATLAARRVVKAEEIANPQTLYGAEAFAQDQRAAVQPALTAQDVQAQSDRTSAFTQQTRGRAKPPSPAQ
jgi:hypothetical protein